MHEEACRFQPQLCPNSQLGCPVVLPCDELVAHAKEECGFRKVACRHCGREMTAKDEEVSQSASQCCESEVV